MRKQRKEQAVEVIQVRLWTYGEAQKAVPYLRSVIQSLREHWLDAQKARREVQRIDERRGRPNRDALILREETVRVGDLAQEDLEAALKELLAIDVYCLDPAAGVALIPFRQGDELAWFVFDLFSPNGIDAWRLHSDPLATRRPLVSFTSPSSWWSRTV